MHRGEKNVFYSVLQVIIKKKTLNADKDYQETAHIFAGIPSGLQSYKLMRQLLDWLTMGRSPAYRAAEPGLNLVLSANVSDESHLNGPLSYGTASVSQQATN